MEEQEVKTNRVFLFALRAIARILRLSLAWTKKHFLNNIPKDGPVLAQCCHFTTAEEAGAILDHFPRQLHIIYKKDLETGSNLVTWLAGRIVKIFLRGAGFVPTEREVKDGGLAVAQTRYLLKQGKAVLAMPERTSRNKTALLEGRGKGTARLAMELDCPMLPVAVVGAKSAITDGVLALIRLKKRHTISTIYGVPIRFSQLGLNLENDPTGVQATDASMIRIAAMLPEHLRGYYQEQCKEFLESDGIDVEFYRQIQPLVQSLS